MRAVDKVLWESHKVLQGRFYKIQLLQDGYDLAWFVTRINPPGVTKSFTVSQTEGPDGMLSRLYFLIDCIESSETAGFNRLPIEN